MEGAEDGTATDFRAEMPDGLRCLEEAIVNFSKIRKQIRDQGYF